ncbi:ExeM/NucH family extracellular endonuclease [Arcanobacterium hippocoleae]
MRKRVTATAAVTSLAFISISPLVFASQTGDHVVINEVYTYGGNKGNQYVDYVELYNPTTQPISLQGWSLQYFSQKGTKAANRIALSGEIAPNSYYLITGKSDKPGYQELTAGANGKLNLAAKDGTVVLFKVADTQTLENPANTVNLANVVDAFSWGKAGIVEGNAETGEKASTTKSFERTTAGADSDNNAQDFTVRTPSPMHGKASAVAANSAGTTQPDNANGNSGTGSSETAGSAGSASGTAEQIHEVAINEIQGTSDTSPLVGKQVKTRGIVTAAYPSGGFNGVYIQTAGAPVAVPEASEGIFVYGSQMAQAVKIGDLVEVTGTVAEYAPDAKKQPEQTITQITRPVWKVLDKGSLTVKPLHLTQVPAGDAEREKLEGMLVQITGDYTVTNNYATNRYGSIGLAAGLKPLPQPSDIANPTTDLARVEQIAKENAAKLITLDDGLSRDFTNKKYNNIPVSYLDVNNPLRVGAQVVFQKPMIVEHRFQWNLQPTEPVVAAANADGNGGYNHSFEHIELRNNQRPAAPGKLAGEISLASFNVLNYFTDLGVNQAKCKAYNDKDGQPVTAKDCQVRGAYSEEAFGRQQAKIVAAINALDASVLGLEEIENAAQFGHERDASLKLLVQALNQAAGSEKWAVVPSPAPEQIPGNEDVIRLAFIYQPALVTPVGSSQILIDPIFAKVARQPLAQKFQVNDAAVSENEFVVVVNHFKSKGSLSKKIADDTDVYQGNNNKLRTAQAQVLVDWVGKNFAQDAVFIIGDLNSYSKEDPVLAIEKAGFTNLAEKYGPLAPSYQFSGLVGSLDHALANAKAAELASGAQVWSVNAMEPLAFEYSRYNYNVAYEKLFDLTPYRSSDHDPIKVGLRFKKSESAAQPEPGGAAGGAAADTADGTSSDSTSGSAGGTGMGTGSSLVGKVNAGKELREQILPQIGNPAVPSVVNSELNRKLALQDSADKDARTVVLAATGSGAVELTLVALLVLAIGVMLRRRNA